jgi:hypothetical protein
MSNNQETDHWRDTAERLFSHAGFTIAWVAFLGAFVTFVAWPIRNFLLVCWVYGGQAYFREGIRVLKGKPIRFSTGELAPTLAELVATLGVFFATVIGLTMLLVFAVRYYERQLKRRDTHTA